MQLIASGEPAIWTWLEKLGYDRDLWGTRSRRYALAVHSRGLEEEDTVEVRIMDALGTDIDNRVSEMILD